MHVDDFRYITDDDDTWRWIKPVLIRLDSSGFKLSADQGCTGIICATKNDIFLYFYLFKKQVYILNKKNIDDNVIIKYFQPVEKLIYESVNYAQLMQKIREQDIIELLENM